MFSYVSPEKRVPADHPLRPIRAMVDQVLKEMSPRMACTPQAHAVGTDATGASIDALYQSIDRLDVRLGDIDEFGGYLFHCLLGDAWPAREFLATPAEGIELEILIQNTDSDLTALQIGTAAEKTRRDFGVLPNPLTRAHRFAYGPTGVTHPPEKTTSRSSPRRPTWIRSARAGERPARRAGY